MDLARHSASIPFVRTLDARWLGDDASGINMQLPLAPAVRDAQAPDHIDLRAAIALLDYAGGAAVYAATASAATATIELRIDVLDAPAAGADAWVDAAVIAQGCGSALVHGAAASSPRGAPFARLVGRYILGSGPGQAPADAAYAAARDAAVARFASAGAGDASSFDETLGAREVEGDWCLPFADRLVGSVTLPAFHGGAIAAALMTAARAAVPAATPLELASLTVRYLHAARGVATSCRARVVKSGPRAAFVDVDAVQGDRTVAVLHALFG
ncbi:acyl-CoA thioesterase domain-containing protein [Piscinibacter koreensis]|uniref:Thioesterase family protein n=1 Tax=Piscinibacter koreensis TaxID=2742824 RepID=A0A7Y6TWH6_9BURK|nr:acyl-CoA thioesterase domain-containing protein [Schlegelella koreensis]NUZ06139.1 thioesterase family protein [Schlegelella koreensis]